jgi:hypothetical protein
MKKRQKMDFFVFPRRMDEDDGAFFFWEEREAFLFPWETMEEKMRALCA